MMTNGSITEPNKKQKPYMVNAIGFVAFMIFCSIGVHSCSKMSIEHEKTNQMELQTQIKK